MIYTVTLNPAIDYVIEADGVQPGCIHTYHDSVYSAGGKGVNVARLSASLGMQTKAVGFVAGFSGEEIASILTESGCDTDLIRLSGGHSRINFKICGADGSETDFNGDGPTLPQDATAQIAKRLQKLQPGDVLVLAGSLPKGMPQTAYADILQQVNTEGVRVVVDTAGDALLHTLPFHPFLIKPNEEELSALLNEPVRSSADALRMAGVMQEKGAANVIVSLGGKGAVMRCASGETLNLSALPGKAVSTVGAGDSLIAGFLFGYAATQAFAPALKWGVAAGAATAFRKGLAEGVHVHALARRHLPELFETC